SLKSWIEAAIEGKAEAQEQLMKQYRGMALAVARRRLGSMLWAEDVVQEAFAEAFANLGKLDKPEAFPGWFKVIVERQCHRHARRKQHKVVPITELLHVDLERDSRHNPEEQALLNEKYRSLHDSIDDLPAALSRVVHMFYFQGYSLK
ncbi:RNA polymerase subunit sigma, partial [Escherichia coli]|nr:RNA polymerase subunit sigma [Escherichia coli]